MLKSPNELLKELGVTPSKDFGQSFLTDSGVIADIVDFARISQNSKIVEIGPGLGALTQELYGRGDLSVIEIEPKFANFIKSKFPEINVINEDVREVDLSEIGDNLIVFGNLPYVFSTDILFHLLAYKTNIKRAIVMFQKEYAERLYAKPNSKKYSSLTLQLGVHAKVVPGPIISGDKFFPEVAVQSQIVEIRYHEKCLCPEDSLFYYQRLVSAGYFKRRKKILNSFKLSKAFNEKELSVIMDCPSFNSNLRAEAVEILEFVEIARYLTRNI
jgi:16S rRNA (adenine1518-N6/adenine1519-N6)-dimethyltransferase